MWTHFIKSKAKTGTKMLNEYLALSGFFVFLFGAIYIVIYLAFCNTLCKKKNFAFAQMKRTQMLEYVGRLVSIIHAVALTLTSAFGCFFIL